MTAASHQPPALRTGGWNATNTFEFRGGGQAATVADLRDGVARQYPNSEDQTREWLAQARA